MVRSKAPQASMMSNNLIKCPVRLYRSTHQARYYGGTWLIGPNIVSKNGYIL